MKKVYLVLLESRKREALAKLKRVGVVHVEIRGRSSTNIEQLQEKRQFFLKALQALPLEAVQKNEKSLSLSYDEVCEFTEKINETAEQARSLREETDKLFREIDSYERWGDFDPETILFLESRGVLLRLYEIRTPELEALPNRGKRFTVFKSKAYTGIVWIGKNEEEFPQDQEPIPLPRKGLLAMKKEYDQKKEQIAKLEKELFSLAQYRSALEQVLAELDDQLEFEQVCADMETEGPLVYLSGFVPEPRVENLKKAAAENGWGLLIRDPEPDEPVPTLIENPRWIRIIQPVFKLLGTIPGYREVDISFFFLIFFSLFFAMIIGDAGYGILLLILSLYFSVKERKRIGMISDGLILLLVMATGTVVWGAITGNWFGYQTLSEIPPFSWMVVPALNSWDPRSSEVVKHFTFIIGTIHLSIAHTWNFLRELKKKPLIRAFTQLGWLSMVLGLYFLVLNLVLDPNKYPVPPFAVYMIGGGVITVLLLGQQEGNFIKGVLKGLGNFITTFLNSISVFADIISYIRLFAVGLASIKIAESFNTMAQGIMTNPIGIVAGILIIVLGHGLNMAMSGLSVIVHGVRLNMLEFSNHLGLEWSGFAYKPFSEREKER
jgi:V/A-type H+-transporting ATPase subunit I